MCLRILFPSISSGATPDVDYSSREDIIQVPARGEPPLLYVSIREDNILEDREVFEVVLGSSSPRVMLGEPSSALVWIEDNDCKCSALLFLPLFLTYMYMYMRLAPVYMYVHVHVCPLSTLFVVD